jgi:hypothetical protein
MKVLEKIAVSIDNAVDLVLGEDMKRPTDVCVRQHPYLDTYWLTVINR